MDFYLFFGHDGVPLRGPVPFLGPLPRPSPRPTCVPFLLPVPFPSLFLMLFLLKMEPLVGNDPTSQLYKSRHHPYNASKAFKMEEGEGFEPPSDNRHPGSNREHYQALSTLHRKMVHRVRFELTTPRF